MKKQREAPYVLHALHDPAPILTNAIMTVASERYVWDGKVAEESYLIGGLRLIFSTPDKISILIACTGKNLDLAHNFTTSVQEVFDGVCLLSGLYDWDSFAHTCPQEGSTALFQQIEHIFTTYFGFEYCWFERGYYATMTNAVRLLKEAERRSL
jgi:hypothetical protein